VRSIVLLAIGVASAATVDVREGGVSLRYDAGDYSGHRVERVAARAAEPDDGPELYAPAHVVVHFEGRPGEASVTVIPVGDAKAYPGIAAAVRALRAAGKTLPRRKALQAMDALSLDARQGIVARVEFVEGPGVTGFAFLAQYTQEELPDPANSRDLEYVFVGLTRDGRHFVEANFSVAHALLPRDPQATKGRARVLAEEAKLAGLQEGTFAPSLARLKDLVRSIEVGK
jgi:hypothetical protein